jgi:hypothetical protein
MLYREIIAVCFQIHAKHINTLCGQNVELLNVKPGAILWVPLCLLCNAYRVSFPAVKWPGRGVENPSPSSAEVKEMGELYRYYYYYYDYYYSGTAWPVLG